VVLPGQGQSAPLATAALPVSVSVRRAPLAAEIVTALRGADGTRNESSGRSGFGSGSAVRRTPPASLARGVQKGFPVGVSLVARASSAGERGARLRRVREELEAHALPSAPLQLRVHHQRHGALVDLGDADRRVRSDDAPSCIPSGLLALNATMLLRSPKRTCGAAELASQMARSWVLATLPELSGCWRSRSSRSRAAAS